MRQRNSTWDEGDTLMQGVLRMPEPITIGGLVLGGLSTLGLLGKASYDRGAIVAKAAADLKAQQLKSETDLKTATLSATSAAAQAAAEEHTADVAERESWRKRLEGLEKRGLERDRLIEQLRDEKFNHQTQVTDLQAQIVKLSLQLTEASAREISLKADIAQLTVQLAAVNAKLELQRPVTPTAFPPMSQ